MSETENQCKIKSLKKKSEERFTFIRKYKTFFNSLEFESEYLKISCSHKIKSKYIHFTILCVFLKGTVKMQYMLLVKNITINHIYSINLSDLWV